MLGACGPRVIVAPCPIDSALLQPIVVDARPADAILGDLASSRRGLSDEITEDNEKKRLLREQIAACGS